MKPTVFTGVCTALVTPFRDGAVDYPKLQQLLDRQIMHGISAVTICGTTGEAATMSEQEQLSVIAHCIRYCQGRMKVIAGTGSNNTSHAVALSKNADAMGADAVLIVTPYYNKATTQGLIEHYVEIAAAVSCPVIVYNVPTRTGVDIPVEVYSRLAQLPNIVGVKEASGNIVKTARILDACGDKFCVWSGNDDMIVPMMSLGAKGVISVLSNLCPTQTLAMTNACLSGDYEAAGRLQCEFTELIDALFCEVNPIPIKEALNLSGLDVGLPRLPLCKMSLSNRSRLIEAMKNQQLMTDE